MIKGGTEAVSCKFQSLGGDYAWIYCINFVTLVQESV